MNNCFCYLLRTLCIVIAGGFASGLCNAKPVSAQAASGRVIEVRGKVTDTAGNILTGVSVMVKGTNRGTATDSNGRYIIDVPDDAILVFSIVGYVPKEIPVEGREVIDVALQPEGQLDEVVVVGFGTQKKISVTGAVSTISMREVERTSTPSLSNAIAGKIPGLISRQGSGEPGYDGAGLIIRGIGSWVSRNPLILVDGVQRDLNTISPQEIESFSILKDASATAVYGIRGANGVILINTKRGKVGKPSVTLRSEVASLTNLRMRDYINGVEYALLMNEALVNVGKSPQWNEAELEKFRSGSDPYLYPNVDWIDTVFKRTTMQTINNLSITGGNEFVKYFTNVGYILQDGIYKADNLNAYNTNANLNRYTFRSNVDINLNSELQLNLGLGGIMDDRNYPGGGAAGIFAGATNTSPIAFPVRNPDGTPGGSGIYLGSNPWAQSTQTGYSVEAHSTLQATFGGRWDLSRLLLQGLSLNGRFGYDYYNHNKTLRYKQFPVRQYIGADPETGEDRYVVHREEQPLGYQIIQNANRAIYLEGVVNYERSFNEHEVSAMLLYNQRDYINQTAGTSLANIPSRNQGVAGRVTYNFKNTYLLEVNAGYNGSENFPKGSRFGFFPSISAGYVVSNESFWKLSAINSLKIRMSHGQVGSDAIGGRRFLFLTDINKNGESYLFGRGQQYWQGIMENQIGVPDVSWEISTKTNAGFDIALFDNWITAQVDFFNEKRDKILLRRDQVPSIVGFQPVSIPYGNLGKASNKGVDAMLEIKRTTRGGLYYSFRGNITYAKNEVIENDEPPQLYPYLSGIGERIDQPWGFVAEGFFESDEEIDNWYDQQALGGRPRIGDIKYLDLNGDNVINTYDQRAIGFARTPELMYGFGGTWAYKGFDLSVFFMGAARTSVFLEGRNFYPFNEGLGVFNIFREYYDNRWTPDNPNPLYPAVSDGNNANNFRRSTIWQKDASYLRLRNVEIGYTLSEAALRTLKVASFRVFANGTNLYTWDTLKVIDPESDNGYPIQMGLNVGVQINF
ncbi:TonB-linked outer membrane protein, SusC/RagA family [Parapedobacter composti]|uniref:TonB-linked outer membrane protein, SusC/RagA family n=1 Tax=Parapedobacter composti TaxID=623281 RepID=A0A1I1KU93_9SPHI|nr:TonB-dependent receptor [Parapedobacter composti]SFC64397.1 TonB-linked outer membrane protein, SusC/RagA family [Parapedobacter composti]